MPDGRSSGRPSPVRPSPSVRCRRPSTTTEPKAVRSLPRMLTLPRFPLSPASRSPHRRRRAAGGQDRSSALRPSVRPSSCGGVRTWLRLRLRLWPPSLTSVLFSVCHSPLFFFFSVPSSSFFHHSLASSPLLKSTTYSHTDRAGERQRWHESKGHRSSVVYSTYSHSYRPMLALRRSLSLTPMGHYQGCPIRSSILLYSNIRRLHLSLCLYDS